MPHRMVLEQSFIKKTKRSNTSHSFPNHLANLKEAIVLQKKKPLAIVSALRHFKYFIYGQHFEIFTDHKALTFMFKAAELPYMLLSWIEEIMEFNFTLSIMEFNFTVITARSNFLNFEPVPTNFLQGRNFSSELNKKTPLELVFYLRIESTAYSSAPSISVCSGGIFGEWLGSCRYGLI